MRRNKTEGQGEGIVENGQKPVLMEEHKFQLPSVLLQHRYKPMELSKEQGLSTEPTATNAPHLPTNTHPCMCMRVHTHRKIACHSMTVHISYTPIFGRSSAT